MKTRCPVCATEIPDYEHAVACPKPGCGFSLRPSDLDGVLLPATQRPKVPIELNVCVCTDATGSSSNFARGIRAMYRQFLDPVEAKAAKLRIWHQTHRDLECHEPIEMVSAGVSSVRQFLIDAGRITFDGGGDAAETHFDAVEAAIQAIPWSSGQSRRERGALIVFANAPSKPTRSGKSARELGLELAQRRIDSYFVVEPDAAWEELRAAAGGLLFAISNDPSADDCRKIAAKLGASITASLTQEHDSPRVSDNRSQLDLTRPIVIEVRGR